MSRATAVALLLLLAPSTPGGAQELGRLFFSPAERAALDAERRDKAATTPQVATPVLLRIDGYLLGSAGQPVVWVNGVARAPGAQPDGLRVTPGAGRPGEVEVVTDARRTGARVKVGNTLERSAGQLRDTGGDAKLTVRR